MIGAIIKLVALLGGGALAVTELPPLLQALTAGGQVVTTANDMELVKTVLFQFQVENGHYPKESELTEVIAKGIGGRVDPEKDRWGTPFRLGGVPKAPFVLSCGPDAECGTEDDLKLWIERVPEGEKQLNFSELVQKNLLDNFLGKVGADEKPAEDAAPDEDGAPGKGQKVEVPSDFEKRLQEIKQKAEAAAAEDEAEEQPKPKKKRHSREGAAETAQAGSDDTSATEQEDSAPKKRRHRRRKHSTEDQ